MVDEVVTKAAGGDPGVLRDDPPLLERAVEIEEIDAALHDARAGRGRTVVLEAHAGIGKSRLLQEAMARASGFELLRARGAPLEIDFAFGVALQLTERALAGRAADERSKLLAGAAGLAIPLLDDAPGDLGREPRERLYALIHGLYWVVANLAQRGPLLLAVDDLHWADTPSLHFLSYLSERVEELPIALVMAWRPGEPNAPEELLTELRRVRSARVLRPSPLSEEAVTELIGRRRGEPAPEFCATFAEATGGNPLLVGELLADLERNEITADASNADRIGELAPEGLVSAIGVRLAGLPAEAEALAKQAAVLGDDAELRHVVALAGLDGDAAACALDALTEMRILAEEGGLVSFTHPLVAAAVRDRLPAGEAGRLHRRAASLLHEAGAVPEVVAAQLDAAPGASESWAFEVLTEAADRASREGAPASAARWLRRAMGEAADRSERAIALAALGRAEIAAGDAGGGEQLAEAAELEMDPERRAQLLQELGSLYAQCGDLERAADVLECAREMIGEDTPLGLEIDCTWLISARHIPGLHERALARMRELLDRPRPSTQAERVLLVAAANEAAFAGEPFERVRELAHRALDGGALLAEETAGGLSWTLAVAALGWADDFETVVCVSENALADARRRGSIVGFANASHARSYGAYQMGRLAEAAADCRQAIDANPDPSRTLLPFSCVQLAWAELDRGDVDAAERALERWDPEHHWLEVPAYTLVLEARGRIALARGRLDDSMRMQLRSGELAAERQIVNPAVVPWRSQAVLAATRIEDWEMARTLAAEELRLARRFGAPRAIGVALRSAGLAERSERGVELLREAATVLDGSGAVLEQARTLVELGAAERRAGSRAVARKTLRRAAALARRCGALALVARAEEELDVAGARPRRAELSGPASLTPSELRVAHMAADGMTNREVAQALFVTVKAVQFHLRNVYRKLEISSREELPKSLSPED